MVTKVPIPKSYGKAGANRTNQQVKITDDIYLVIGFEVNGIATAYNPHTNTHNFMEDTGHAFFFTVKNGSVVSFFSFGPNDNARELTMKQQITARPATAKYGIHEKTQLFKFKISTEQLNQIQKNTNLFDLSVSTGNIKYDFSRNITCAERAKETLDNSNVKTPSAKGKIYIAKEAGDFIGDTTLWGEYDNPYSWHNRIKNTYGKGINFNLVGWRLSTDYYIQTDNNFADITCANYHGDLSQ